MIAGTNMATGVIARRIDSSKVVNALMILRAIDHPIRKRISRYIETSKSVNVTDISDSLNIDQGVVSQYLKIMRNANIVNRSKQGKERYYSINYDTIERINKALKHIR